MDIYTFFPPFAGVLLAFMIQWGYTWFQNRRKRRNLLVGVKAELEFVKKRLDEHAVKRIAEEGLFEWSSGVSSGTVQLLNPRIREKLGRTYFAIQNYNYEAEIVRRLGDEARQAIGTAEEKPRKELWRQHSMDIFLMESNMSNSVEGLLKDYFWST